MQIMINGMFSVSDLTLNISGLFYFTGENTKMSKDAFLICTRK